MNKSGRPIHTSVQSGVGDVKPQKSGDPELSPGLIGKALVAGTGALAFVNDNGGDDTILGERGLDTLHGGDGDDTLRGGADQDLLIGHDGEDNLNGQGCGPDTLVGSDAFDILDDNAGSDLVDGAFVFAADWIDAA